MKNPIHNVFLLFLLLVLFCNSSIYADVKLPALIDNNMVLQCNMNTRIWGWADPGERVTVKVADQQKTTVTDDDGRWAVKLKSIKAGGPYEMTVTGKNMIKLSNILVGEVWVCSGQSNMQWPVKFSADSKREIADGNHPMIRLFILNKQGAPEPREDCLGHWDYCSFRTVGEFSGVGYYFGRELMKDLDVPVGLIQSAWGGTPAEAWTSLDALKAEPSLNPILDGWGKILSEKPQELVEYYDLISAWFVFAFECMGQKEPYGDIPKPPEGYDRGIWIPSWNYNAMIAPLTSCTIRGVIWYQGESNVGRAYRYRTLFPALIKDWRLNWGQGNFPFLFVQLANVSGRDSKPSESTWAELREAQLMTLNLPNTGMAVTIDIGEAGDVHFKNKQDAGLRLAKSALNVAYGRDIVHSGPIYDSMKIRGGKVSVRFKHTGSGLVTGDGGTLKGFAIAGADLQFVWANAVIDGDKIVVWSDEVAQPIAVRYAWGNNPDCNLYNRERFPASPFRTDRKK